MLNYIAYSRKYTQRIRILYLIGRFQCSCRIFMNMFCSKYASLLPALKLIHYNLVLWWHNAYREVGIQYAIFLDLIDYPFKLSYQTFGNLFRSYCIPLWPYRRLFTNSFTFFLLVLSNAVFSTALLLSLAPWVVSIHLHIN